MEISELQKEVVDWNTRNFPIEPSYLALLKAMEELGELAGHYVRRREQRIGEKQTDHQAGVEDGVADVIIALSVFCHREKIDLAATVNRVWGEVSKRKYIVIPQDSD